MAYAFILYSEAWLWHESLAHFFLSIWIRGAVLSVRSGCYSLEHYTPWEVVSILSSVLDFGFQYGSLLLLEYRPLTPDKCITVRPRLGHHIGAFHETYRSPSLLVSLRVSYFIKDPVIGHSLPCHYRLRTNRIGL